MTQRSKCQGLLLVLTDIQRISLTDMPHTMSHFSNSEQLHILHAFSFHVEVFHRPRFSKALLGVGKTHFKQDWHLDSTLTILSPTVWQQQEHIKRNSAFTHSPPSSIVEKVVPSVPSCHCLLFLSQQNTVRHYCRFPPVDAFLVNHPFSSTSVGDFLTL